MQAVAIPFQPDELISGLRKASSYAGENMRGVTFSGEHIERMVATLESMQRQIPKPKVR